jgi:hypothetical protein
MDYTVRLWRTPSAAASTRGHPAHSAPAAALVCTFAPRKQQHGQPCGVIVHSKHFLKPRLGCTIHAAYFPPSGRRYCSSCVGHRSLDFPDLTEHSSHNCFIARYSSAYSQSAPIDGDGAGAGSCFFTQEHATCKDFFLFLSCVDNRVATAFSERKSSVAPRELR